MKRAICLVMVSYHNTGPGSAVNADVPQLTAAQAAQYTVASYLGGWWPK